MKKWCLSSLFSYLHCLSGESDEVAEQLNFCFFGGFSSLSESRDAIISFFLFEAQQGHS